MKLKYDEPLSNLAFNVHLRPSATAWLAPKMLEGMDAEAIQEMQDSMANQPTMEDLFSGKAFKDLEEKEDKKGGEGKKTGKEVRAEKRSQ